MNDESRFHKIIKDHKKHGNILASTLQVLALSRFQFYALSLQSNLTRSHHV